MELTHVHTYHTKEYVQLAASGTQVPWDTFLVHSGSFLVGSGCMETIRSAGFAAGLWPFRKSCMHGHHLLGGHPEGLGNLMAWRLLW